jgi:heat shock protein HtpX
MFRSVRLKPEALRSHRVSNLIQTVLLATGLLGFLALLGFLIAGLAGILWALTLGLISFVAGRRLGPLIVLSMYRASPLAPAEAPGLYGAVRKLAERADLPAVPRLFYVPSSMLNAFALNVEGRPVIGLTDGLLRSLNGRELAGVLGHEIGHIRNRDLTVMGLADVVSRLTQAFSWVGQILLLVSLPVFFLQGIAVPWLLILILLAAPSLSALLQMALSRTREFDADLEAVRLTGDPEAYISALNKIECQGAGFFERIFMPGRRVPVPSLLRTHPETSERIARIRSMLEVYRPALSLEELVNLLPLRLTRIARPPRWRVGGLWY